MQIVPGTVVVLTVANVLVFLVTQETVFIVKVSSRAVFFVFQDI